MSRDPSLLPEELRKPESERRDDPSSTPQPDDGFHVPVNGTLPFAAPPPPPTSPVAPPPPMPPPSSPPALAAPALPPPLPLPPRARGTNGGAPRNGRRQNGRPRPSGSLHVPPNGPAPRIGISLIPTAASGGITSERAVRSALLAGMVLAVCVAGGWLALRELAQREEVALDALTQPQDAAVQPADVASDRLALEATIRQATAARSLLDRHRTWGTFLRFLEERTLPGVEYQSMTADVDGTVTLAVQAPSTRAAAEQLVALRGTEGVQAVDATGLSTTVDELGVTRGARFDVRIRVDPKFFEAR